MLNLPPSPFKKPLSQQGSIVEAEKIARLSIAQGSTTLN